MERKYTDKKGVSIERGLLYGGVKKNTDVKGTYMYGWGKYKKKKQGYICSYKNDM